VPNSTVIVAQSGKEGYTNNTVKWNGIIINRIRRIIKEVIMSPETILSDIFSIAIFRPYHFLQRMELECQ
jgi:hypothetical protein